MEISAELTSKVKTSVRATTTDQGLNDEIVDLIKTALTELARVGIKKLDQTDPLIISACNAYVKANFGYDNPDAARFQSVFDNIQASLSMTGEYTTEPEVQP
jgi:hypothetical protein